MMQLFYCLSGWCIYDFDSSFLFFFFFCLYFGCRYLVAISALAFVYSLVQSLRHIHRFRRGVDPTMVQMQSPGIGDFIGDQVCFFIFIFILYKYFYVNFFEYQHIISSFKIYMKLTKWMYNLNWSFGGGEMINHGRTQKACYLFIYFCRVLFQKLKWSDTKWELSSAQRISIYIYIYI
jgi:hypothetical protein